MRETSLEAFRKIRDEGLLSERRFQVYATLYKYGPCTANELAKNFHLMNFNLAKNVNMNIVTRLGELRDAGVAREVRERECSVTGMRVIEWDVTDGLPVKPPKKTKKLRCPHCDGTGYYKPPEALHNSFKATKWKETLFD